MYKIVVTNIISPENFHAQIGSDESFKYFKQLEEHCRELAESNKNSEVDLESLEEGQWVLGYSQQIEKWTRAQIHMITEDEVDVRFVDYEITELLSAENIIAPVPEWVYETRPMTVKCKLSGIKPLTKNWISRASKFLNEKILFKELAVEVLTPNAIPPAPYEVDIIVQMNFAFKSVSNLLKEEGLAMDAEPTDQVMAAQPVKETDNRNSPAVPQFDINQLKKKPGPTEPTTKVEDCTPDFEELLFTKGLGGETYEQHLDSKLTAMDPEIESRFTPINISEQLKEMKLANEKAERGTKFKSKVQHSPAAGSRERPRSGEKRSGMGRGAPPQDSNSPKLTGNKTENLSPMHPSLRQSSASPANRSTRMQDSPKRPQGRQAGKNITPERGTYLNVNDKHRNEYEWRLDQFHFKLKQILDKYTDQKLTIADATGLLTKLIHPAKLSLADFGGKGELEVGLKYLCRKGIEEKDDYNKSAVKLVEVFKGEENFNMIMSELLWNLQSDYLKVKRTSTSNDKHLAGYCKLLAQLYIVGQQWDDNSSIDSCVVNTLDKWTNAFCIGGFSRRAESSRAELELYAECLTHFLSEVGLKIENLLQTQIEHLFQVLERRIKDKDLTRSTRGKLSDLITLRKGGTWLKREEEVVLDLIEKQKFKKKPHDSEHRSEEPPEPIRHAELENEKIASSNPRKTEGNDDINESEVLLPNSGSGDSLESDMRRKGRIQIYEQVLNSPDLVHDGNVPKVHRVAKTFIDKCVQTDSVTEVSPSICSSCSSRSKGQDKYNRVRTMLFDLELEEFWQGFVENGIRDSVLDLDFSEVKDLLKDCGVKAGQILEIKAYLKKQSAICISRSDQSSSSPSIYSDTVDSLALLNQSTLGVQTARNIETEPPPGFSRIGKTPYMDNQDLQQGKTLFSPQDFEISNIGIEASNNIIYPGNESRQNSYNVNLDRHSNSNVKSSIPGSKSNTMANAAARLAQIDRGDMLSSADNTCDPVTRDNNYQHAANMWESKDHYCDSPVDNLENDLDDMDSRPTKSSSIRQRDSEQNNVKKEIYNPSSPDSLDPNHPRTKYNMSGIKNMVGGWLSSVNETRETVNVENKQNDLSSSYKERVKKKSSINYNIGSSDGRKNPSGKNVYRSPEERRSDKAMSEVVSPSSYLPPSPRTDPVSMDEFPSLTEAKEIETERATDNHPALRKGPKELSYMEKYRVAMQIPDPTIVNQRVSQFGSQVPMCSFCGNRGGHLSHECPDKDKYMFY